MARGRRKTVTSLDVPWITDEGYLDPSKFPIDGVLKQTVDQDLEKFRSGATMLQSMTSSGRLEAGVYLLGLLRHYQDNLERLEVIVDKLRIFETPECADTLVMELRRVRSSNKTRRYLGTVIDVLSSLPYEMVKERLESLADDRTFSYKMRQKFLDAVDIARYRSQGY
jgi:hypothetical protein